MRGLHPSSTILSSHENDNTAISNLLSNSLIILHTVQEPVLIPIHGAIAVVLVNIPLKAGMSTTEQVIMTDITLGKD